MKHMFGAIFALVFVAAMAAGVPATASAAPSGASIEVGGQIGDTTLFHITYDANGGTGGFVGPGVSPGGSDTILSEADTDISQSGYTFMSWNTEADGTGTSYRPGDTVVLSSDITLFAQWEEVPFYDYTFTAEFGTFRGSGDLRGKVNADYVKFVGLFIDHKQVDVSDYTVSEGSTIITLKEGYLKTLANGTYTVRASFSDGIAETTFAVSVLASPVPSASSGGVGATNTGDNWTIWLLPAVLIVLGLSSIGIALVMRRRA